MLGEVDAEGCSQGGGGSSHPYPFPSPFCPNPCYFARGRATRIAICPSWQGAGSLLSPNNVAVGLLHADSCPKTQCGDPQHSAPALAGANPIQACKNIFTWCQMNESRGGKGWLSLGQGKPSAMQPQEAAGTTVRVSIRPSRLGTLALGSQGTTSTVARQERGTQELLLSFTSSSLHQEPGQHQLQDLLL